MPMDRLDTRRTSVLDDIAALSLQTALAGLSQRQQVTANNVANLETPGFTARNVDFESSLADAISAGDPTQAAISTVSSSAPAGANGNNVSLSDQLVNSTKTQLQEELLSGDLTSKFSLISTVLKG
jgi:flagellar basal-body rod protein FlgB